MSAAGQREFAAVIFDMDGIVADTEHLWDDSWRAYADEHDVAWSHQDSLRLQGLSVPEWSAVVAEQVGTVGQAVGCARFCIGYIIDAIEAGDDRLMAGAQELIDYAAARLPIALATSSARPIIEVLLGRHHLLEVFGATVSSAEVPRGKPSPDVYLEAARRIGVDGRPVIGIEDSGNGIRAVHAAGMYGIAIPNRQFPPAADALALADHVADDHAQALDHLKSLLPVDPLRSRM